MTHRKGVLWVFVALVTVAVAVLLFLPFTRSGDRPEGAARATLTQLSHLLEQWHQQHSTYPTDILEVGDLLASDIPVEGREALFTDPWGKPITYRFPSNRASCEFQLYSNGPNGRDEGGAGDDIDTDSRGRRLTAPPAAHPAPGVPKTLAVPTNDRIGLNHMQHMPPARPQPRRQNPEESMGTREPGSRMRPFEHGELLTERQVLEREISEASDG